MIRKRRRFFMVRAITFFTFLFFTFVDQLFSTYSLRIFFPLRVLGSFLFLFLSFRFLIELKRTFRFFMVRAITFFIFLNPNRFLLNRLRFRFPWSRSFKIIGNNFMIIVITIFQSFYFPFVFVNQT